jgi:uncharacterized membrane protein YidH (DUF202 family)
MGGSKQSPFSWVKALIALFIIAISAAALFCAYSIQYLAESDKSSRQEYLEGLLMASVWAVPACVIVLVLTIRHRGALMLWHKLVLSVPSLALCAALLADLLLPSR